MRATHRLSHLTAIALVVLGAFALTAEAARDEKPAGGGKRPAAASVVDRIYAKEMEALGQAEKLMIEIVDEKSATQVARKLINIFNPLPVPMGGTDKQLEALACAQNVISRKMNKLRKEPWFVSSGLQEAWGLITVPSFRRRATNHDK